VELKTYWQIVIKRWWIVAAMTVLAIAASLVGVVLIPQSVSYSAVVRLAVKPTAVLALPTYYTYDEYYSFLSSEYLNDDVIEMIQGGSFMEDVRARLKDTSGGAPVGSIRALKAHRVLSLTTTAGSPGGALALAQGALDVLAQDAASGGSYFAKVSNQRPQVAVVDPPFLLPGTTTRIQLDLALRGVVGLIAGVALAFLLDYLDDTLRDAADAERTTGLPVLGQIPSDGRVARGKAARAPAGAG
jgi:capsular polysaccharide biosynthesis protein